MRRVDTLRVSVTDRCNLRCVYCMPSEGVVRAPPREILRFEEIERVVRAAVREGVTRVRLTGGEPLVRRGLPDLAARLARIPGIDDLPLTTNGVLLGDYAERLKAAGLTRVTVSMDTLRPERYRRITGRPWLGRVLEGIEAARSAGLGPVKVNVVVVPGENDDEVVDFARLAAGLAVEVRYIERMPLMSVEASTRCGPASDAYIPAARVRQTIEHELGPLAPVPGQDPGRPAKVYDLPGGKGRVGFIAPMSEPFCAQCSRLRLTPDGKLRMCLALDNELDLKGPLRNGAGPDDLAQLVRRAITLKPIQDAACFAPISRTMAQIGG